MKRTAPPRSILNAAAALGLAWAALLLPGVRAGEPGPSDAAVRAAVARSLPALERYGVAWMKDRGCMSCHTFTFTIWAHQEARQHGLAVDEAKLAEWTTWAREAYLARRNWFKLTVPALRALPESGVPAAVRDKLLPLRDLPFVTEEEFVRALGQRLAADEVAAHRAVLIERATQAPDAKKDAGGLDALHQLILGDPTFVPGPAEGAWLGVLTETLRPAGPPDALWKAGGQLPRQNRPAAESDAVTSAWTGLALAALDQNHAGAKQLLNAARPRLKAIQPGQSNESLMVCLLLEQQFGTPGRASELRAELLKRQNPDGGWAWLNGRPSDAFATGQALYALSYLAPPDDNSAVHRARSYLLDTQGQDGTWAVPPDRISNTTDAKRLAKLEPIYRHWGTAWTAVGLLKTLR